MVPVLMKREEVKEDAEEKEEPGVMGVKGKPIPPAKWLLPLECVGLRSTLEVDVPKRAELKSHHAMRSPKETNWKNGEF